MNETRAENLKKIKSEKRNLYLMAAVKTFQEKGFYETRVKDITDRASTSVGNFYRYFKSKEEIFEVLIENFNKLIQGKLLDLSNEEIPRISSIKKLFAELIKIFEEKSNVALIFIDQMAGINKKYAELKQGYMNEGIENVDKILSHLQKIGFIREQNSKLTSTLWVNGIFDTFSWWIKSGKKVPKDKLIKYLTDFLVKGTVTK